jgi:hypothetical protein
MTGRISGRRYRRSLPHLPNETLAAKKTACAFKSSDSQDAPLAKSWSILIGK